MIYLYCGLVFVLSLLVGYLGRANERLRRERVSQASAMEMDLMEIAVLEAGLREVMKYNELRAQARLFAENINRLCPDSREKSLAITALEETMMWANAAIARRE